MNKTEDEKDLRGWVPPVPPGPVTLEGRWVRLERLDADCHAGDLHRAFAPDDRLWDYMAYGPFQDEAAYRDWVGGVSGGADPFFYALVDRGTGRAGGVASYLRITPEHGVIEVGHICLGPDLQATRAASEAMFLMADWVFAAGYRRYEWKCNALNRASRRAAERFGFSHEGTFRQHMIVKGRNRDTAWFAMTDSDWRALRPVWERWLDPDNFGPDASQRLRLSDLTRPILVGADPDRNA